MTDSEKWLLFGGICFGGYLLYLLTPVLAPFMVAALLAYLGDPLVNRLQRWHIPRTIAVILIFFMFVIIFGLLLLGLVPLLQRQIAVSISRIPDLLAWIQDTVLPWLNAHLGFNETIDLPRVKAEIAQHWQQAGGLAAGLWKTITHSGFALFSFLAKFVLVPVVAFYLMRDWDTVINSFSNLLPRSIEPTVSLICRECDEVLGAFFRGQLLVMLGLGVVYTVGLMIVGLDLALLIGMVAGIASIVPYLGFIVGITAATIASLVQFHDGIHLLYVAIAFGVGQVTESMILVPLLIGDRIGLHPVAVIFAILVGDQLFGFVGILLALPAAAVIMVILRHLRMRYVNSHMYSV